MLEDKILRRELNPRILKWFMLSIAVLIAAIFTIIESHDSPGMSWPMAIALIFVSAIVAIRGFRHLTTLKVMKITNEGIYNLTVSKLKRQILIRWKSIDFWTLVQIDKKNFLILTVDPNLAAQFNGESYVNNTNEKNMIVIEITKMQDDHAKLLAEMIKYHKIPEKVKNI